MAKGQCWPDPLLADSGNGGHLMYRIDEPAEDDGLLEKRLHALQHRFGDSAVKVDTTVHNPARIWKLYGTMAAKGDSTPDRPHRMAHIIDAPELLEAVPTDKLKALAAEAPATKKTKGSASTTSTSRTAPKASFDLAGWIAEHNLDVRGPEDWRRRTNLAVRHLPVERRPHERERVCCPTSKWST